MNIPMMVLALAEKVAGKPIAWKEYPNGWKIVFEDGRKIFFARGPEVKEVIHEEDVPTAAPEKAEQGARLDKPVARSRKKKGEVEA